MPEIMNTLAQWQAERVLNLWLKERLWRVVQYRNWNRVEYSTSAFWVVWAILNRGYMNFGIAGIHIHDDGEVVMVYWSNEEI